MPAVCDARRLLCLSGSAVHVWSMEGVYILLNLQGLLPGAVGSHASIIEGSNYRVETRGVRSNYNFV